MINARVLEILKSPELLNSSDVELLKREISNYPYIQSIRAVYLLALNKFSPKDYQKELALTAAYTTDKKILFQLVNPSKQEQKEEKPIPEQEIIPAKEEEKTEAKNNIQQKEVAPDLPENKEDSAKTSFAGSGSFLPEVSFKVPEKHKQYVGNRTPNPLPKIENFAPKVTKKESKNLPLEEDTLEEIDHAAIDFSPHEFQPKLQEKSSSPTPDFEKETPTEEHSISTEPEIIETSTEENTSNVPLFINTWSNWLHKTQPNIAHNKLSNDSIDKFIRENPKIRSSKETSKFTVKEKSSDISHLMTETLANLYLKQKSYEKAVEAFQTLKEKHPEKASYFEEKISSVKKLLS